MERRTFGRLTMAGLLAATARSGGANASSLDELASRHAAATFREWVELLAIPNVATVGADIQRNVAWLERAFERRGFRTRQLANDDKPMLLAELPGAAADRRTVLFYAHLDGQPVEPAEWGQRSPWEPVLKRRAAEGRWEPLPIDRLYGPEIDPEWRLFARSASDDKAPIVMLLAAMDALKAAGQAPSVNVKVLLDSQEEQGSPTLGRVIGEHLEALRCDALVVLDGPMHESNRPTLVFGNRGIVAATLTVFGGAGELHSGHYGNYAPNPAQRLAALLASMKDGDGRVTIAGWHEGVALDGEARRVLAAVPDDEAALRRRLGIAEAERVGGNYQEALQYPSLNVRGLAAAGVGASARTVVPASATAEIDIRTVPETPPRRLFDLLRRHVEAQGYHLVEGPRPTEEERRRHGKLASLTFREGSASSTAVRTDLDAPIGRWLHRGFRSAYGAEPVRVRMMGGTVPTGAAVEALRAPFATVPLVNADNNQHSFDENMRLGNYVDGVKGLIGLLREPF